MISERIKRLEKACAKRAAQAEPNHFLADYHKAALEKYASLPLWERAARAMADTIAGMKVYAYPEDELGGRVYHANNVKPPQKDAQLDDQALGAAAFSKICPEAAELKKYQLLGSTTRGHISWHWERVLSLGIEGLQREVSELLTTAKDEKAVEFYRGVLMQLEALLVFNDKHIAVYEAMGKTELAQRMRKVPRFPAETFAEAVQSYYMQHIVVMSENPYGGNSPGRLDYYLWPYLQRDLEKNVCTMEQAKELVDELLLRIDERIHMLDLWGETVVVGGSHPDGTPAENPLTYLMLRSMMDLNITHPYFYIRLPENPSEQLWKISAEYLLSGNNRAQILSDPAIIRALQNKGVPFEEAVHYGCGGCMEISVQGATSDYLYGGWQNVAKMLELMITGGVCLKTGERVAGWDATKGLTGYDDYESFYRDFIAEAKRLVHLYMRQQDIYSAQSENARPAYLISSLLDDCLLRGRNMHDGGVRYHDYGSTPLGLPNVADGLYAIKQSVFEQKICTAEQLLAAMKANYKGYEKLQASLRRIAKYGMDDEQADAVMVRLCSDFAQMYQSCEVRHGGRAIPVILTFVFAPRAAQMLGATPDGRCAGSLVAHGITPHSASMTEGITAAINSCTKLPFELFGGGASSMWDFDAQIITPELMTALLKTFVQQGGQIFQGNTTPVEELLAAQQEPENYPHLFVRVGGFSARFVYLDKELQDEIIGRIRHRS